MSNPFHVPARDASVAQIRAAYETAFGRPPAAGDERSPIAWPSLCATPRPKAPQRRR